MLSTELCAAAGSLEARFEILNIPSRRVPLSDWNIVPREVMAMLPLWLPELLDRFRLVGGTLVCRDQSRTSGLIAPFTFYEPDDYRTTAHEYVDDPIQKEFIIDAGLIPLSYAGNGDYWVTTMRGGCDSPIYYHSLTGLENIHACQRISHLLSCAGVTDFYNRYPKSHSIWDLTDEYRSREAAQKIFPHDPAIYDQLIDVSERMHDDQKVRFWRAEKKAKTRSLF